MNILFPLGLSPFLPFVLSLSKDTSRPDPGFDKFSPNGTGPDQ